MPDLPLHPMLVHLPIALAMLVPLVASGILLAWHRGWLPKRAFAVAALLQLVLVTSGLAALRTGEGDEERVERVVSEASLEAHEEAAETFLWGAGATLALFAAATLLSDRPVAKGLAAAATVGSLAVLGLGLETGHAGGRLVYQDGAAAAYTGSRGAASPHATSATTAPSATPTASLRTSRDDD